MNALETADVIVMGGGLAGLTLAIQLRRRLPDLDILVLERERHPVPAAAHKVGESSVEIGAHYFSQVLGLEEHLSTHQLKKFGFRFFFSDGETEIDRVAELGASRYLATPSYQIDRGLFENFLGTHARMLGIRFLDGAVIRDFSLAGSAECARSAGSAESGESAASAGSDDSAARHTVRYVHSGSEHHAAARWLIDAAGRASLIKTRLDLAQDNEHEANAIWFRVEGRIDVQDWSSDRDWLARCDPPDRWLSTNHLCGEGYWAWLIPLASGAHSVGIVADARIHPLKSMNSLEKTLDWLQAHQPPLAAALKAHGGKVLDFCCFRNFSYGCKQMYSGRRWALTGDAGVFLDPFYSPGSDFIAIGNTYITDLIARDLAGEPFSALATFYEQLYFSFYRNMLTLYTRQYALFGDPEVMPVKVIWDYTYYWGVLCQFFFQGRLTDLRAMRRLRQELAGCNALNEAVQKVLRAWSAKSMRRNRAVLFDQAELDWFAELNRGLRDRLSGDAEFDARVRANLELLRQLASEILARADASGAAGTESAAGLRAILGQARLPTGAELLFSDAA